MAEVALKLDTVETSTDGPAGGHVLDGPLRCIVMDDSRFDRKLLRNIAKSSRYEIEFTEATCIADTRAKLQAQPFDLMVLDYRVPDGDGIEFARQIINDERYSQTAIIMMTGEGSESTAIEALRTGVVDYLPKDELSADLLDRAIEKALDGVAEKQTDLATQLALQQEENAALRRIALRNMRLLKGQSMTLIAYAGKAAAGQGNVTGNQVAEQRQVAKVTRNIIGLIDDTIITASTHHAIDEPEPVDLAGVIGAIVNDTQSEIHASHAHVQIGTLPVIRARASQISMLFEELLTNAVRSDIVGKVPEIGISSAFDPQGNTIIVIEEKLVELSSRKAALVQGEVGAKYIGASPKRDPYAMSLCQRIVEKNEGELKIISTSDDTSKVMLRFPQNMIVSER